MKAKKALAVLTSLALLAGMVPALTLTFTPKAQAYSSYTKAHSTEYSYASGTQFIYQLGLYYSSSSDADAEQHILDAGFTPFGVDFNVNAGGKYIHAGYKSTTDPAQAVKALRIWHASNDPTSTSSFINGSTCAFYQVGSGASELTPDVMDGMVGLNKGNGGDSLELFVTQDYDAGPAITALSMANHETAATAQEILLNFGYTIATSFQAVTTPQDLNAGAGSGTDYNYIGYKSDCTTVDSDALRAAYQSAKAYYERGNTGTALSNALTAAANILADLNDGYTTYTQAQIDTAADSLTAVLPEIVLAYADYPAPTGTEYYYPAGTQFISQLALTASDANNSTAAQDLQRMGFTPFGRSFNANVAGSDVRGGYKTTTDPMQAATALRVWRGSGCPDIAVSEINGATCYFYQVGSGASALTPDTFGKINLNLGNSGDDLRLFVTDDSAAGLPITFFKMDNFIIQLTQYGYTVADSFHSPGTAQNLNSGTGSTGNFLGWKSAGFSAVDSSALRSIYAREKRRYEIYGFSRMLHALDQASAILDDLKDGYTTYTQAQIDAAAEALRSLYPDYVVFLSSFYDNEDWHIDFGGQNIQFEINHDDIAASREAAGPYQFYYEDDGRVGFYLSNDFIPDIYSIDDGYIFGSWMYPTPNALSDTGYDWHVAPEYITMTETERTFYAKETTPLPPPGVPDSITIAEFETQTAFGFHVGSCFNMNDGCFTERCKFSAEMYDGILTGVDGSATIPYTMTSNGEGATRKTDENTGQSYVTYGVKIGAFAPNDCECFINIDADAFANAAPGVYMGTLNWTWSDAKNSGGGEIPLTLTVSGLSAEERAEINSVIGLINAIGTVENTAACKAKIDDARDAYDALNEQQKAQVTNYATLTAAEAAYEAFSQIWVGAHSLTLDGDIGVNFYVDVPNATDRAFAVFTVDGKSVTVPIELSKYIEQNGLTLYKFTCDVAAAQIDTEITGVIHNGEIASDEFTYTVQDYLTEAQTTMADDEKFMALASSLATYGYYANELFGFNLAFTRHALFDDSGFANVKAASLAHYEAQIWDYDYGVTYVGSSLVLRTETAIKHYFKLPAGKTVDDFTFLLGDGNDAIVLTPKANGSFYYVEIPNIRSGDLGTAYTVKVVNDSGNENNFWTYSALSYVHKVLTKAEAFDAVDSAKLANVCKALTLYYQAADAYFCPQGYSFLLTDNLGWGVGYVYAWDADGNPLLGDYPGTQAETTTNDYGETQFIIRLPEDAVGCFVCNGFGAQTEEIADFNSYTGYWMDGRQDDIGHYYVTGY